MTHDPHDDHYRLIGFYLLVVLVFVIWFFALLHTKCNAKMNIDFYRVNVMNQCMDSMLYVTSSCQHDIFCATDVIDGSFKCNETPDMSSANIYHRRARRCGARKKQARQIRNPRLMGCSQRGHVPLCMTIRKIPWSKRNLALWNT